MSHYALLRTRLAGPAGDPVPPAPVPEVSIATIDPNLGDRAALEARVRAARGPLGASGAHAFVLIVQNAPPEAQVYARVLGNDRAMTETRALIPLSPTPSTERVAGLRGRVPETAIDLEIALADGRVVRVPWEAIAPLADGSDTAVVDAARIAPPQTFLARHGRHLAVGGAVALAVAAVVALSSGDPARPNPSCGPDCGCAPCRKRHGRKGR